MTKNIDDKLNSIEKGLEEVKTDLNNVKIDLENVKKEMRENHNEQMNKLDSIAKSLETNEEERIIAGGQIDELHEEIEKFQKIHPNYTHQPLVA